LRLAILTPAPDYGVPWRWAYDVEANALAAAGFAVEPLAWNSGADLGQFDLILPLVAWGYHKREADWHAWLDRAQAARWPVANSVPLLRWNSDKAYLETLFAAGVPTVPSLTIDKFDEDGLARARASFGDDLVVKPLVSASAFGTHRLGIGDRVPDEVRGWRMLAQPWLQHITSSGEWSLIYFDGNFSHAVTKRPRDGEFRVQPEFGGIISGCDAPPGAREVADAALSQAPTASTYARVDIVRGNDGELQVIELELIEPALWLEHAPDPGAFAAAVRSAAQRARE
jgi:glutathione synthase/RimK-type ligase-like ATP-grasp enzyme